MEHEIKKIKEHINFEKDKLDLSVFLNIGDKGRD